LLNKILRAPVVWKKQPAFLIFQRVTNYNLVTGENKKKAIISGKLKLNESLSDTFWGASRLIILSTEDGLYCPSSIIALRNLLQLQPLFSDFAAFLPASYSPPPAGSLRSR
jgi:hypothetical protein